MATNIEYIYHPPIDIGTHVPPPSVHATPSFREHLAGPRDTLRPTDAPVDDNRPNDNSSLEPAERDEPLQHVQEEQPAGDERPVKEEALEEVVAHPEQSTRDNKPLESEGVLVRDDFEQGAELDQEGLPPVEQGEEVTLPSIASEETDDTLEVASQQQLDDSGNSQSDKQTSGTAKDGTQSTDKVVAKIATPSSEPTSFDAETEAALVPSKLDGEEFAKSDSADKPLPTDRAENKKAQPEQTLARRDQPLVASETAKSDSLPTNKQPQDVVTPAATHAKQKLETRDKRTTSRTESSKTELEPVNVRPTGPIADRDRQLPPILTEVVASTDDKASVEPAAAAAKPSSQPTSQGQEIESTQSQGTAGQTGKEGNASDRLASVLSASRPSESSQSPLTESQQSRLVQRVAKAFDIARARGDSSVRLRLTPPQLGALRIELQVESGALTARLEVETQAAREALLENLNTLRNRLAEQNIRVDQFDVDVLDQRSDDPWGSGERQESSHREENSETRTIRKSKEESASATTRVTTEILLDEGVIDVII